MDFESLGRLCLDMCPLVMGNSTLKVLGVFDSSIIKLREKVRLGEKLL